MCCKKWLNFTRKRHASFGNSPADSREIKEIAKHDCLPSNESPHSRTCILKLNGETKGMSWEIKLHDFCPHYRKTTYSL